MEPELLLSPEGLAAALGVCPALGHVLFGLLSAAACWPAWWSLRKVCLACFRLRRGQATVEEEEAVFEEEAHQGGEQSPALRAFLDALAGDGAAYDHASRLLSAPGALVKFAPGLIGGSWYADEALVADQSEKLESLLQGGREGAEWRTACAAAEARREEVVERDRRRANLAAAAQIDARQHRAVAAPAQAANVPPGEPGDVLEWDGGLPGWRLVRRKTAAPQKHQAQACVGGMAPPDLKSALEAARRVAEARAEAGLGGKGR